MIDKDRRSNVVRRVPSTAADGDDGGVARCGDPSPCPRAAGGGPLCALPLEAQLEESDGDDEMGNDTRPLITYEWIAANPAEWDRLYASCPGDCPVCLQPRPRDAMDAAMCHEGVHTRCTHWVCINCWEQIAGRDRRCPICRDDLSEWLRRR